tara:strand:+ start:14018 stop:14569 length:552 start_codon:yes stop_codon:yes gene_type:complete
MLIHKTHSKKDLINIIKNFNINIPDPSLHKKKQLLTLLKKELLTMEEIEPELDIYMFYNLVDLKTFLSSCNPKKLLSIKEKNNVIMICKRLQQLVNNNYIIESSSFKDIEEVERLGKFIEPYGDIPSVRRACKELNKHPNRIFKFEPIISKQTLRELEKRAEYKKKYPIKLEVRTGSFTISFD